MSIQSNPPILVTLIHGTWAPDATWIRENSTFRRGLQDKLNLPIEFIPFPWTGHNTHTHRLEAAADLRKHLQNLKKDHLHLSHFIIAHSHGGNIACYALRDDTLRGAISGLICLGTPFLHVQPSNLPRSLLHAAYLFMGTSFLLGVRFFFAPENPVLNIIIGTAVAPLALVCVLLLLALLRGRQPRLGLKALLGARRELEELVRDLSFPPLMPERFIVVRISGDEAAGALVASQFFVWLFRYVWTRLAPIWETFDRLASWILWVVVAIAAILALVNNIVRGSLMMLVIGFLSLLIGLPVFGFGLLSYILLLLILLMHFPFGLDTMLAGFDLQTTAEPSPPGVTTVFHVTSLQADVLGTLRHCEIYDYPQVIEFVSDWIRDRVDATL